MDIATRYPWSVGKILAREEARNKAQELRASGKRLVTINGSFDLLHAGHVVILDEAKKQGDVLFVGLNSDASVRQNKGDMRPIVPEQERAALLTALACVDYVVLFDEREIAKEVLETVKPHVHVNGSEYGSPEHWVEWPTMERLGVHGHQVARRDGFATTDLIRKIKELA